MKAGATTGATSFEGGGIKGGVAERLSTTGATLLEGPEKLLTTR